MRLLVMFDLPVKTKTERKLASQFRKYLLSDGFYMVQFSIYCRICNGHESVKAHEKALEDHIPTVGLVRTLIVTEKQYNSMGILVGNKKPNEKNFIEGQISIF